jgi:hypothetical protein
MPSRRSFFDGARPWRRLHVVAGPRSTTPGLEDLNHATADNHGQPNIVERALDETSAPMRRVRPHDGAKRRARTRSGVQGVACSGGVRWCDDARARTIPILEAVVERKGLPSALEPGKTDPSIPCCGRGVCVARRASHARPAPTQEDLASVRQQVRARVLRCSPAGHLEQADARDSRSHSGGFSLDASARIEGPERAGLERLLRYCARPPLPWSGSSGSLTTSSSIVFPSPSPMAARNCASCLWN